MPLPGGRWISSRKMTEAQVIVRGNLSAVTTWNYAKEAGGRAVQRNPGVTQKPS
jgi:hypothetical protein